MILVKNTKNVNKNIYFVIPFTTWTFNMFIVVWAKYFFVICKITIALMNQFKIVLSLLSQKNIHLDSITDLDTDFLKLIGEIFPGSSLKNGIFYPQMPKHNIQITFNTEYPVACYLNSLLIIIPFLKIRLVLNGVTNLCHKSTVADDNHGKSMPKYKVENYYGKQIRDFGTCIDSIRVKVKLLKMFGAEVKYKLVKRGFNSEKIGVVLLENEKILERLNQINVTRIACKRIKTLIVSSHINDFLPKQIRTCIKNNIPDVRIDMDRSKNGTTAGMQILMYCKYFYYETYNINDSDSCCKEMMKYIFERIISKDVFDDKLTPLVTILTCIATGVSKIRMHVDESLISIVKLFFSVDITKNKEIVCIVGSDYSNIWN